MKDRFNSEEGARAFLQTNLVPLNQQYPIKDIVLKLFTECDKRFWRDLSLPNTLPSALFQVFITFFSKFQDKAPQVQTYFTEINELITELEEQSLKFQFAQELNTIAIKDLEFYSKFCSVTFGMEKFKRAKDALIKFEHTLNALLHFYEVNKDLLP